MVIAAVLVDPGLKFNGKIRLIIQYLKNFQFSTEITVLPFFEKFEFFPGFTKRVQERDT